MRAMITGGTGFVGSNLAKHLIKEGHEVVVTGTHNEQQVPGCRFLQHNLNGICWDGIKDIDVLFHQAANNDTLDQNDDNMMQSNVQSAKWVFEEALLRGGCKQFVFASSTAVYGNAPAPYIDDQIRPNWTIRNPLNAYARSKVQFEKVAMDFAINHRVNVVGLRYCNVYGPGEEHKGRRASMIYQLIMQMKNGIRPKIFKYGWHRRDWIHVDDVVRANCCAAQYKGQNIFNCGSGESITFNSMVEIINGSLGIWLEPEFVDCPFKEAYQNHTECDMTYAKNTLGFAPQYSIEDGMEKYIEYLWDK